MNDIPSALWAHQHYDLTAVRFNRAHSSDLLYFSVSEGFEFSMTVQFPVKRAHLFHMLATKQCHKSRALAKQWLFSSKRCACNLPWYSNYHDIHGIKIWIVCFNKWEKSAIRTKISSGVDRVQSVEKNHHHGQKMCLSRSVRWAQTMDNRTESTRCTVVVWCAERQPRE